MILENLTDKQKQNFELYFKELIEYNAKVNLTAITEKEEVFNKHFLDSILPVEEIPKNSKLIDVGTGAGFPSLPIKIVRDDIDITMLDSLNKRVDFLKYITSKLNIKAECIHSRAEDFAKQNFEKYDICVSRAVASLSTLCEYCLPFVKKGGMFLSYKGLKYEEEIGEAKNAIKILGGEIEKIEKYILPNDMGERSIIFIRKVNSTPKKYPRGGNLPKKQPLK